MNNLKLLVLALCIGGFIFVGCNTNKNKPIEYIPKVVWGQPLTIEKQDNKYIITVTPDQKEDIDNAILILSKSEWVVIIK